MKHLRDGEAYLVVVPLAALAVPAARDTFHHLLPLARATRDTADGGRQRGVARLPTHVLDLRTEGEGTRFQTFYLVSNAPAGISIGR